MPIRKCFITYHHDDESTVRSFVKHFDHNYGSFIVRRLGEMPDDLVNSTNTDYVMSCIRRDYIRDSTVTLVLAGRCTWARRYVDWEIQASLRSGQVTTPNGLLGIKLPTFTQWPERFANNLAIPPSKKSYAGYIDYPRSTKELEDAIEWAFQRRTTCAQYINNPRERYTYNRNCI